MNVDWQGQADELLGIMAWGLDALTAPRIGKVYGPNAGPRYRQRVRHQLRRLEQRRLIVSEKRAGQLLYKLTDLGRLAAMGGRNPDTQWSRPWDGTWRLVLFDLPEGQQVLRQKLLRWLRRNSFGYLQDSVWVSPDPMHEVREVLEPFRDDVEFFIVMEARVCAGYSNRSLVDGAWDFTEINRRYRQYLDVLNHRSSDQLPTWLRDERAAWVHATSLDPMLPTPLLPRDYLGQDAWRARRRRLRHALRPLARLLS